MLLLVAVISMPNSSHSQIADQVFRNGKIYTNNNTFVQAMAIKAGDIIYLGSNAGAEVHTGGLTIVEDLAGKLVLPGLHDIHMHPLEASSPIGGDCLLDASETNPENFISALQACNLTPNSNGWITAAGHSIFTFFEAPLNSRYPFEILDDVYPSTPAMVMEETSHSVWVNSVGMTLLGLTAATPDPIGGHIVKDPTNGNIPTGILLDNAGDVVLSAAFANNATIQAQNKAGLVDYGLPLLAQNGITSICEGRTYWKRNYHTIWQSIKNEGKLTCRVVLAPWVYPDDNDATLIPALQALYDDGDDMLRSTQLKLYADGIVINATAALHAPYLYNWDLPFDSGLNYIDENRMTSLITTLEQTGFDFHIHAIGDRGITESLNAIETARLNNGNIGARHRITHLEIVDALDIPRFAQLNVTADMQVTGDFTNPANWSESNFLLGASRTDSLIPLKAFYDAGARVALSSDWDVSSVSPFVGMQNALTRSPQQLPSVEAALKAYTIDAAYVMRQEDVTGSLAVGKWADFIVVDRDIFTIPTNQISNTEVLMTYVGGNEVYRKTSHCIADLNINNDLPACSQEQAGITNGVYNGRNINVSNALLGGGELYLEATNSIAVDPETTINPVSSLDIVPCPTNKEAGRTGFSPYAKLLSFEVKDAACTITLEWEMDESGLPQYFDLQRSKNGKYFETIARIDNTKNLAQTKFTFTDEAALEKNYYRLKRGCPDLKETFSKKIIGVKYCPKEFDCRLSQSITGNLSFVQINGGKKSKVSIELWAANGKLVKSFIVRHDGKFSQSPINVRFLPEGVYEVRVNSVKNRYVGAKTLVVSR